MIRKEFQFEVLVVGGGAAGLSAGVLLSRARRKVLVIDSGKPRNASAAGVHNFLTRDGVSPQEMLSLGRAELERYGGQFRSGEARSARRVDRGFEVETGGGAVITARRLLVTTGLVDELPEVPGLRDLWGADVVHCPFCHGWEVRDRPLGVLGTSARAIHQTQLFREVCDDVVLFAHTSPFPTEQEAEALAARGVQVVAGLVTGLEVAGGRMTGVRLEDGTVVPRRAVAVGPRFVARSDLLRSLGLEPEEHPMGVGQYVPADPLGRTAVPGVWVAGNVTDLMAPVITSASEGVTAASAIHGDLIMEDTEDAVAAYRQTRSTELTGSRS